MQASVLALARAHCNWRFILKQSLLVSAQDVVGLRATFAQPLFSPILAAFPTFRFALEHPQPDFAWYVDEVSGAISEVRSNTNYPEDWDDLDEAVDEARAARRAYDDALEAEQPTPSSAPEAKLTTLYALVYERRRSADSATYGKKLFSDFGEACDALREWAQRDFCEDGDGFQLEESQGEGRLYIDLTAEGGHVACSYSLRAFTL